MALFQRSGNEGCSQAARGPSYWTVTQDAPTKTPIPNGYQEPSWGPDGTSIAHAFDTWDDNAESDSRNVFGLHLNGSGLLQVTHYPAGTYLLAPQSSVVTGRWRHHRVQPVRGRVVAALYLIASDGSGEPTKLADNASSVDWQSIVG